MTSFVSFSNISIACKQLISLKAEYPTHPADPQTLNLLRVISKISRVPANELEKKSEQISELILSEVAKDLIDLAKNSESPSIQSAAEVLLRLVVSDDSQQSYFKPLAAKFKGVDFTATLQGTQVLFSASTSYDWLKPVISAIKPKTVAVPVASTLKEIIEAQDNINQEFSAYRLTTCRTISREKQNLEKRIKNLGFSQNDLDFLKSFW